MSKLRIYKGENNFRGSVNDDDKNHIKMPQKLTKLSKSVVHSCKELVAGKSGLTDNPETVL